MIIFLGPENRGDWIRETADKREEEFRILPVRGKIAEQVSEVLQISCQCMVFDIEQYGDPADVLADQIVKLSRANNAKVIVYAPGSSTESYALAAVVERSVKNFILSTTLSDQKEEMARCLNGTYQLPGKEFKAGLLKERQERRGAGNMLQTIGIVGVLPRIGTTTQALQIIKYLQFSGYSACYIEMNCHRYVELLMKWMGSVKLEEPLGNAVYGNVDLYYDEKKLQNARKQSYDYYVYDYGAYQEQGFHKDSFLEKDLQVIVCGSSPSELEQTFPVIKNTFYDESHYLFSLTPEADQRDLLEMMEEKAERTYFAPYTPDPFVLSNAQFYQQMLLLEKTEQKKPKKKGLFGRKGRWRD